MRPALIAIGIVGCCLCAGGSHAADVDLEIILAADVSRSIDDGDIVSRSFELPERNVDCDATFTLGLELVEHPGIFEGALAKFGSFLQSAVSICVTMGYDFAKWRCGDGCNCFGGLDRRSMLPAAL